MSENSKRICQRRESYFCHRLDAADVNEFNRTIATTGVAQPPVSDVIVVFNVGASECYMVFLHQVNHGSPATPRVGELLKLSEQQFAPHRARELWLRTPAYYRKTESSDKKPTDPHDGFLTKDATPWMRRALASKVDPSDSLSGTMTFSSPEEPWVYCTSISPTSGAETKELKARFPRYDAMKSVQSKNWHMPKAATRWVFGKANITLTRSSVCTMAQWSTRTNPASWGSWRMPSTPQWSPRAGSQRRRSSPGSENTVLPCPLSESRERIPSSYVYPTS